MENAVKDVPPLLRHSVVAIAAHSQVMGRLMKGEGDQGSIIPAMSAMLDMLTVSSQSATWAGWPALASALNRRRDEWRGVWDIVVEQRGVSLDDRAHLILIVTGLLGDIVGLIHPTEGGDDEH